MTTTPNNLILRPLPATLRLSRWWHDSIEEGACALEAVSYMAGEAWSERPLCVSDSFYTLLRQLNDALDDDEREALLRPLLPLLIGTRGTVEVERRRGYMALDWLVRVNVPAWLRVADLHAPADALAALPEITDFSQLSTIDALLAVAERDTAAAVAAARDAAAEGSGAWATIAAAWAADAAGDAVWATVAAAKARAEAAAARATTEAALGPTRQHIQQSAVDLVHRMIAAA